MAQSQAFKLGYASIVVKSDEFGNGYTNGLLAHSDQEAMTVEAIRAMIEEAVQDVSEPADWNTGYIVGAIRGLFEGNYKGEREYEAPCVQFGPLTLYLNRWRFRDGYYNGQRDYEVNHADQAAPDRLTAGELLAYIAHRDPATQVYYFGQDELSAIEDVLGQLIGYLCAAFSASMAHESVTEPLPNPALQASS
jgi:hypothetical protein